MRMLTAEEEGLRRSEMTALAQRDSFSKYLPYLAYNEKTGEYLNSDETIGRIWECRPVPFLSQKTATMLTGLLRQDYPVQTIFQFILYPDDHIDPILDEYRRLKTRPDELIQEAARRYADHLSAGRKGVGALRGIPVRNFRLFVAVKTPEALGNERIAMIEEALGASGFAPRRLLPGALLEWLRRLFNEHVPQNAQCYDENRYIRAQVINAETRISVDLDKGTVKLGERFAACLTPKAMPDGFDNLQMNKLIGGYAGLEDDTTQLLNRFLWCTTIFFRPNLKQTVQRDGTITMSQRAGGSLAKALGRRVQEFNWVLDDIENEPYCNVITSMWIFGDDEEDLNKGLARARNLWEKQGFVMQRDTQIVVPMFYGALPFGLYTDGEKYPAINVLDRDFKMSVVAASKLLPVQSDFAGNMRPVLLFVGRKGQLVSVDVFDKGANNHNYLVCAGSGAGKSFSTNFLVGNYYATNSLIRIVDIGDSYEKQCAAAKGRYIDIGAEAERICLNPFASIGATLSAEDQSGDESTTVAVILTMIYSATGMQNLTQTQYTLVKDAQRWARRLDGGEMGIDHVARYLREFPKHCEDHGRLDAAAPLAHEMAFNLRDFCSNGRYGKMFNGKSTLNIGSDHFVVMELDRLMNDQTLYKVVSMQVINAITQDLYLSDRSSKRFMLFDEAWKYFTSAPMIADIIQEGYRRARKYGGSTGIVTQSPLDLLNFGPAGAVVRSNSAYKFFLQSDAYAEAVRKGVLEYEGLLLELACGVMNNRPHYSEVLFETPYGAGVGRLCVDRWTYWMYTSSADERAAFKALTHQGLTPRAAIDRLAGT